MDSKKNQFKFMIQLIQKQKEEKKLKKNIYTPNNRLNNL